MRRCCLAAILFTMCSFFGVAHGGQPRLSDEILADPGTFASQIDAQLRRNDATQSAVIKSIAPDLEDASQWRFHPRDRGLLVAIPVKRNLLVTDKYAGEAAIIDVIERLIRQRDLSGRVEVVFIEPASLDCYIRTPRASGCGAGGFTMGCNCQ
jgi:hypothetical protein